MDIKTTCLGVLALGEASGYEIRKHFEEGPFSHFAEGAYGSIYPALGRLTQAGLLTCVEHAQDGRPDKKVYSITDAGHHALLDAMHKLPPDDKYKSDFLFILFFTDHQSPEWVAEVIDARIASYREKLERMAECEFAEAGHRGPRLVHGFGVAIYQSALDYLVQNREAFIDAAGRTDLVQAAE